MGNRRALADMLAELNALDEHARIDAKTSRDIGTSVLETVCAFANTPNLGGGYLLLGVAPAKNSLFPVYDAVGVDNADKVQADLASQCTSVFNALVRPEIRRSPPCCTMRIWRKRRAAAFASYAI